MSTKGDPPGSATPLSSHLTLGRSMGLFSGTMLITGTMIGSGIFSTPGFIFRDLQNPIAAILIWVVGGLFCAMGAAVYIELGCLHPSNAGEKDYLAIGFPRPKRLASFAFSYAMMLLIRPAACAADAIVFASYMLYVGNGGLVKVDGYGNGLWWAERGIAVASIVMVTLLQCLSTNWALRAQNLLTMCKLLLLAAVSIIGLVVVATGGIPGVPSADNFRNLAPPSTDPAAYVNALYLVLFTFDGWNSLNYNMAELRDPTRNLPRAAFGSILMAAGLFLSANMAYFAVVPASVIAASEQAIGAEFFHRLMLPPLIANKIIPLMLGLAPLGAIFCMSFTAARVVLESARDGYIPFGGGSISLLSRWNTPAAAIIVHNFITLVLVIAAPPEDGYTFMVELSVVPSYLFYFLTVLAMLRLRWLLPSAPRPVRVWLAAPLGFLIASGFVIGWSFVPPMRVKDRISRDGVPYWVPSIVAVAVLLLTIPLWYAQIVVRKGLESSLYGQIRESQHLGDETMVYDGDDTPWRAGKA